MNCLLRVWLLTCALVGVCQALDLNATVVPPDENNAVRTLGATLLTEYLVTGLTANTPLPPQWSGPNLLGPGWEPWRAVDGNLSTAWLSGSVAVSGGIQVLAQQPIIIYH